MSNFDENPVVKFFFLLGIVLLALDLRNLCRSQGHKDFLSSGSVIILALAFRRALQF